MVGKGLAVVLVALVAGACGSDDDTLYKWSCSCADACAATLEDARSKSGCTGGDVAQCTPTGDSCVCPDEASSCKIVIP